MGHFHQSPINTFAISQDSHTIVTGSQDFSSIIVNISTGRIIGSLGEHTESVESIDICDSMGFFATASVDNTVKVWDGVSLRVRHTLKHEDAVTKIQFIKNSTILVTGSADKNIRLWESRTGECVKTLKGHQAAILDFSINGGRLVAGSDDGTALVFDLSF